ncbi:3-oxoacyl-ACP synthase III family protein [Amycolatopsis sp. CA-230715]|uniref:3-oxoacyl-ACP synthase III family protein n=1 Tax=Amycolatopsis sp. CA-230715 TaxID=2745196 RepID=UPI001C01D9EE|nr:ketoacyl-ACP synthase III [Amycolatopsis sp. CA-230715]QWF78535.1 Acetoacetyl CoA synthase NphT7 [Amycolatopsis sp. CA-230715]
MTEKTAGIVATGSYLPERKVTNDEVAARVPDITAEWIERKTLIRGRRYAAPDEATSDLAAKAAIEALDQAGLSADQLDYLIVSTSTGDSPQPPTACLVQLAIGAHRAACFDINVVCAGFVYGLELARTLVSASPGTKVMVIGADLYSRILDFDDRSTAVLLGDGAGAAIVAEVEAPYGILATDLSTKGEAHELIRVEAGGSRLPSSAETLADGGHFFKMYGRGVRDFVMEHVPPATRGLLARAGLGVEDVQHFVPHQANGVLLGELVERCGLTGARTCRTLEEFGNIGSASVPVALDDAHRSGSLRDGDLLLLAGFGGGMSLGASLVRWSAPVKELVR